ncbi:MAG: FdrA family protein [Candidatus Bathyarchaeia archaeon]
MKISEELKKVPGVIDAIVAMGTDLNKELAKRLGFHTAEIEMASPDDLFIAIRADSEESLAEALAKGRVLIAQPLAKLELEEFGNIDNALAALPDANLAVISVPGKYVKDIAFKFLERGIHVHIFSDNVPREHETELKRYAYKRGLLVLGPGAGTSIIRGKGICFANAIRKGSIGVVAAAGTGLQEVSALLHEMGLGISYGLGVGGGDVKNHVGGLMTKLSLLYLERDAETSIIAFISKPPERETFESILGFIAERVSKPVVMSIMGRENIGVPQALSRRIHLSKTLHSAALKIMRLADPQIYEKAKDKYTLDVNELEAVLKPHYEQLKGCQKYVRCLYTGGTLASEALVILDALGIEAYTNIPFDGHAILVDPYKSVGNTVIDLGEEEFTRGRAHPMMDPTVRKLRLIEEARDPETAVILMDFVLGYGSHPDPVGAHIDSIRKAKKVAKENGRHVIFVSHVLGVREDPQDLDKQVETLKAEGVIVMPTNAMAVFASIYAANRGKLTSSIIDTFYADLLEHPSTR